MLFGTEAVLSSATLLVDVVENPRPGEPHALFNLAVAPARRPERPTTFQLIAPASHVARLAQECAENSLVATQTPDSTSKLQRLRGECGWIEPEAVIAWIIQLFPDVPFEPPHYWYDLTSETRPRSHLFVVDERKDGGRLAIKQHFEAGSNAEPYSEERWQAFIDALTQDGSIVSDAVVVGRSDMHPGPPFVELWLTPEAQEAYLKDCLSRILRRFVRSA